MKIVSLVPSITETLFDFGLTANEVIGRTKFCIHPKEKVGEVHKIGGTKNIKIDEIKSLKPDLIIANKEENTKEQVEELQKTENVWVTNIENFDNNISFITALGERLNKTEMARDFNDRMQNIITNSQRNTPQKVAYLIWRKPYMSIGNDTYIHDILHRLGFENILKDTTRYPEVNLSDLKKADTIFLSSEPYPFSEKHIQEIQQVLPNSIIQLVDGEAFSWYGTRLLHCEEYLSSLK